MTRTVCAYFDFSPIVRAVTLVRFERGRAHGAAESKLVGGLTPQTALVPAGRPLQ